MREILFRGKRTDNGEWVYGYVGIAFTIDENKKVKSRHFTALDCLGWSSQVLVSDETIGQYTGLCDKNGVRIFEGDIVLYGTNTNRAKNKETHEVVFETRGGSGYFGIRISEIETWKFCLEVPAKLMEVIGNIHDKTELLKGGADNDR